MTTLLGIYKTPYYDTNTKEYKHVITLRPPIASPSTAMQPSLRTMPLPPISEYKGLHTSACHQIAWDANRNEPMDANDNSLVFINDLIRHQSFSIDSTLTQLHQSIQLSDNSTLIVVGRIT